MTFKTGGIDDGRVRRVRAILAVSPKTHLLPSAYLPNRPFRRQRIPEMAPVPVSIRTRALEPSDFLVSNGIQTKSLTFEVVHVELVAITQFEETCW